MADAFRPGLSIYLDCCGHGVIAGPVLDEFRWLVRTLGRAVSEFPDE